MGKDTNPCTSNSHFSDLFHSSIILNSKYNIMKCEVYFSYSHFQEVSEDLIVTDLRKNRS